MSISDKCGVKHDIPIKFHMKKGKKDDRVDSRDGSYYVKIVGSFTNETRGLTATYFELAIQQQSELITASKANVSFYKDTKTPNGHRYIFVRIPEGKTADEAVPDNLVVKLHSFRLQHKDKMRQCYECGEKHGNICPQEEEYKRLVTIRDAKAKTTKIYGDSTVRCANQLGLAANVATMPGGCIGQIANAIAVDDEKVPNIIVIAGQNDMTKHNDKEYVYSVNAAAKKLSDLSTNETKVTFIMPPINTGDDYLTSTRREYMMQRMTDEDNVEVVRLEKEYEKDHTQHPTQKATAEIIKDVIENTEAINNDTIIDLKYLSTKKYYAQAEWLFKMGCAGCTNLGYLRKPLCNTCTDSADKIDTSRYDAIQKQHFENHNLAASNTDDEMNTSTYAPGKRGLEDNDDDGNHAAKKGTAVTGDAGGKND